MKRRICVIALGLLALVGCTPTDPDPTPTPTKSAVQIVQEEATARGYAYDEVTYGSPGDGRHGNVLFKLIDGMEHPEYAHLAYWEITENGVVHIGCFNADGNYGVDDFLEWPDQWAYFIRVGACPVPRLNQPSPTASA
jgi:hypothetical protein